MALTTYFCNKTLPIKNGTYNVMECTTHNIKRQQQFSYYFKRVEMLNGVVRSRRGFPCCRIKITKYLTKIVRPDKFRCK